MVRAQKMGRIERFDESQPQIIQLPICGIREHSMKLSGPMGVSEERIGHLKIGNTIVRGCPICVSEYISEFERQHNIANSPITPENFTNERFLRDENRASILRACNRCGQNEVGAPGVAGERGTYCDECLDELYGKWPIPSSFLLRNTESKLLYVRLPVCSDLDHFDNSKKGTLKRLHGIRLYGCSECVSELITQWHKDKDGFFEAMKTQQGAEWQ